MRNIGIGGAMTWCNYCDPKFFVIYGFCANCKRRCEPPLFDPKGNQSAIDYIDQCSNWNAERADLILDEMLRCPIEEAEE